MNFRTLIARAMNEARDEYEAIVARKLDALFAGNSPTTAKPKATRQARAVKSAPAPKKRRARSPADDVGAIAERLVTIVGHAPVSRSQIAGAIGVEATSPVLASALAKLRAAGTIEMQGSKRNAAYVLATGSGEASSQVAAE